MTQKLITLLILQMVFFSAFSQEKINWSVIQVPKLRIEFSLPENAKMYDTLETKLYSSAIDTTEAMQVHIFEDARFSTSEPVFNEALRQENGDTLRAIAKLMLLITNSELTALEGIKTGKHRALEIGFVYKTLQTNYPYHTFVRYYMINNIFVSFSWTCSETKLQKGILNKNKFFNSIKIE